MTEDKEVKEKKDVAIVKHDVGNCTIDTINLLDEKQLASAKRFLTEIVRSEKGGIKTINDGLAILMRAKDLALPFSTCIEHIHVVSGKTVIDIHIIKALLSKAQVTWECTHDYTCLYQYTDGNIAYNENNLPEYCKKCATAKEAAEITKESNGDIVGVYQVRYYQDYNGNVYDEFKLNSNFAIAPNRMVAAEIAKQNKIPIFRIPPQPIDYITEYKFKRARSIGNEIHIQECTSHFSYQEAQQAGFFTKDTYQKYARIMISHRAFTLGARDIASDILMGCQEKLEWKLQDNIAINDNDVIDAEVETVEE